eukprot:gene28991-32183_t
MGTTEFNMHSERRKRPNLGLPDHKLLDNGGQLGKIASNKLVMVNMVPGGGGYKFHDIQTKDFDEFKSLCGKKHDAKTFESGPSINDGAMEAGASIGARSGALEAGPSMSDGALEPVASIFDGSKEACASICNGAMEACPSTGAGALALEFVASIHSGNGPVESRSSIRDGALEAVASISDEVLEADPRSCDEAQCRGDSPKQIVVQEEGRPKRKRTPKLSRDSVAHAVWLRHCPQEEYKAELERLASASQ